MIAFNYGYPLISNGFCQLSTVNGKSYIKALCAIKGQSLKKIFFF